MMGRQTGDQGQLFYLFNLGKARSSMSCFSLAGTFAVSNARRLFASAAPAALCNSFRIAWPAESNWPPSFDAAPSWASEIAELDPD